MPYTIAETDEFIKQVKDIWSDDERLEFFDFLANNPLFGDVIPKGQGLRKIRWSAKQKGKRGGARVIYYNLLDDGLIICVAIYAKNDTENLSLNQLKTLKE